MALFRFRRRPVVRTMSAHCRCCEAATAAAASDSRVCMQMQGRGSAAFSFARNRETNVSSNHKHGRLGSRRGDHAGDGGGGRCRDEHHLGGAQPEPVRGPAAGRARARAHRAPLGARRVAATKAAPSRLVVRRKPFRHGSECVSKEGGSELRQVNTSLMPAPSSGWYMPAAAVSRSRARSSRSTSASPP